MTVDVVQLLDEKDLEKESEDIQEMTLRVQNIDRFSVEVTEHHQAEVPQICATNTVFITQLAYLLLIIAMLSIASGGVAFKMFPADVTPLLGSFWRAQATVICLIPFLIVELYRMSPEQRIQLRNKKIWGSILYCGISSAMWSGTFACALGFTSLTRVYLLNNCQPILLALWSKATGKPVTIAQTIGVILGMVGLILTVMNSNFLEMTKTELIGDGIALLGAFFAAIYITVGSNIRSSIPGTFTFMVAMWTVSLIMFGIGALTYEKASWASLIGWFDTSHCWIVLWLSLVTGLIGVSMVLVVMKYLTPLTIAVVLLCEPVAASLFAVILGVEQLPSPITWIGVAVVTVGVLCVTIDCYSCKKCKYSKMNDG